MDRVKKLWILLSDQAVRVCNEPFAEVAEEKATQVMDPGLLSEIVQLAGQSDIACTLLADRNGVPDALRPQLAALKHSVIVPMDRKTDGEAKNGGVVLDEEEASLGEERGPRAAIWRSSKRNLGALADKVLELLRCHTGVSIRHPEVLTYTKEDFSLYKEQLYTIGEHLLSKGSSWLERRVDVLTGRIGLEDPNECGAGDGSLAVAPDGTLYICPAAFRTGWGPCGHILKGTKITNRQLFARHYALPCREDCDATHCSRCVYLNKRATLEFSVPAENTCRLAHVELDVQAWLASKAIEQGVWKNGSGKIPQRPFIDDPYQLVKADAVRDKAKEAWQRLSLFAGRREDLSAVMMLDIMRGLKARVEALRTGASSGFIVPADVIEDNVLLYLRRKTVERYKEVRLAEDVPTLYEIEMLLYHMMSTLVEQDPKAVADEVKDEPALVPGGSRSG